MPSRGLLPPLPLNTLFSTTPVPCRGPQLPLCVPIVSSPGAFRSSGSRQHLPPPDLPVRSSRERPSPFRQRCPTRPAAASRLRGGSARSRQRARHLLSSRSARRPCPSSLWFRPGELLPPRCVVSSPRVPPVRRAPSQTVGGPHPVLLRLSIPDPIFFFLPSLFFPFRSLSRCFTHPFQLLAFFCVRMLSCCLSCLCPRKHHCQFAPLPSQTPFPCRASLHPPPEEVAKKSATPTHHPFPVVARGAEGWVVAIVRSFPLFIRARGSAFRSLWGEKRLTGP